MARWRASTCGAFCDGWCHATPEIPERDAGGSRFRRPRPSPGSGTGRLAPDPTGCRPRPTLERALKGARPRVTAAARDLPLAGAGGERPVGAILQDAAHEAAVRDA